MKGGVCIKNVQKCSVNKLKPRQKKAIEMLVYQGKSKTETAKELNLAPQTLSRWLNPNLNPDFVETFEDAIKVAENIRKRNYKAVAMKAQDKLVELIDSKKPEIALKACKEILDRAGDISIEIEEKTTGDESTDSFINALEGKAAEAIGDKETAKKLKTKLSETSKSLNEFCEKNKLKRDYSRELVSEQVYKKNVAKSQNSGIIEVRSEKMLINKSSSASPLYISEKDELYNNAKNIEPIEGYEDIVIHSDKTGFYSYNMQGDEFAFSPADMANMIKQSKGYHGGNIRLIACESAAEGSTLAQELADILGVEILAPSDIVWVDPNGEMSIGATPDLNTGKWVKIKPKGD